MTSFQALQRKMHYEHSKDIDKFNKKNNHMWAIPDINLNEITEEIKINEINHNYNPYDANYYNLDIEKKESLKKRQKSKVPGFYRVNNLRKILSFRSIADYEYNFENIEKKE